LGENADAELLPAWVLHGTTRVHGLRRSHWLYWLHLGWWGARPVVALRRFRLPFKPSSRLTTCMWLLCPGFTPSQT